MPGVPCDPSSCTRLSLEVVLVPGELQECVPLVLIGRGALCLRRLRDGLNHFADGLSANEAKSTEVLVQFQALSLHGNQQPLRLFFLLGRRSLRPKFQLWVPCVRTGEAMAGTTLAGDDAYPFEVDLVGEQCRMGGGVALAMWTSDEVARHLAQRSKRWVLQRLRFSIPHRPHLLTNTVTGPVGGPANLEGAPKSHRTSEFKQLSRVQARRGSQGTTGSGIVFRASAKSSSSTPSAESRGNGLAPPAQPVAASDDPDDPLADLDEEVGLDVVFGDGAEQVAKCSEQVLEALAEALLPLEDEADEEAGETHTPRGEAREESEGAAPPTKDTTTMAGAPDEAPTAREVASSSANAPQHVAHQTSASSAAPASAAAPAPEEEAPPASFGFAPDGSDISDPSGMAYMYRAGRSICRVNPTKKNTAIRCYLHSGQCSLLISTYQCPPVSDIKKWLACAELVASTDTKQEADAKPQLHLAALKALRDQHRAATGGGGRRRSDA